MSGMFIDVNMKAIFVVISCSENKAWKKKKKKKKKGPCGIWSHDLCDIGAVLMAIIHKRSVNLEISP